MVELLLLTGIQNNSVFGTITSTGGGSGGGNAVANPAAEHLVVLVVEDLTQVHPADLELLIKDLLGNAQQNPNSGGGGGGQVKAGTRLPTLVEMEEMV